MPGPPGTSCPRSTEGFLYKDFRHITQFLNGRMLTEGLSLNVFDKLDHYAQRYFKTERARQILEYTMVFLGSSPFKTPALYSLMSHADISTGVFYPMGGFSKLADGFRSLGEELGVTYRLNATVDRILSQGGRVTGVQIEGGEVVPADVVLSNADYYHTETELLEPRDQSYSESYWNKRTWGPAMFKFCYALDKRVTGLAHHNLYLPKNWKEHFDSIDVNPDWPSRPAFYLGSPSQTDRSLVPTPDGEVLFFLVPISNCAQFFNARHGTALGLAHTLGQTAVFRPHLRSKKLQGLYYTGQMTQPGIGVPMVVISGEIAAGAIIKDAGV